VAVSVFRLLVDRKTVPNENVTEKSNPVASWCVYGVGFGSKDGVIEIRGHGGIIPVEFDSGRRVAPAVVRPADAASSPFPALAGLGCPDLER